ncbi:hypothetical protein AVEN_264362-1 [Araneus ventricosus]|uniref:Uncharacterized protein n=1 Tax=Araneus ventricosus TaxID=182803 RepID=A0A4Y2H4J3_ARAVE|nr:hypothetical protein AVEN_264362-1 [Araneus ventricosus]
MVGSGTTITDLAAKVQQSWITVQQNAIRHLYDRMFVLNKVVSTKGRTINITGIDKDFAREENCSPFDPPVSPFTSTQGDNFDDALEKVINISHDIWSCGLILRDSFRNAVAATGSYRWGVDNNI